MKTSNCCGANIISKSIDMCSACFEHCEVVDDGIDFDLDEVMQKSTRGFKPYTKEAQIGAGRMKPKKKSTFGQKPSNGNFGKNQTGFSAKSINKKPKAKRNDIIDDNYSKWLGTQRCCITGQKAKRGIGANNMHCHHIYGRNGIINDYIQVPLIGWVHSWNNKAYHNNTKSDYIKKNKIMTDNIIEFFEDLTEYYIDLYVEQGGVLKTDDWQQKHLK